MTPDMTVLNINCGPKSSCIPSDVVGKDDGPEKGHIRHASSFQCYFILPHAGFPRSRLSHEQNFFPVHD